MPDQSQPKILDILLGGVGGAIIASIVAVLLNQYFDSVERTERARIKEQILEAKKVVMDEIIEARKEERTHALEAIKRTEKAFLYSENAEKRTKEIIQEFEKQEKRIAELVLGIEDASDVSVNDVANILKGEVLSKVATLIPTDAVVAFARSKCPEGWSAYSHANGRVIVGMGKGDGLSNRELFEKGGEEKHTLTTNEMPSHTHTVSVGRADTGSGGNKLPYRAHPNQGAWNTQASGGSEPHNNMPPYLVLQFCIKS